MPRGLILPHAGPRPEGPKVRGSGGDRPGRTRLASGRRAGGSRGSRPPASWPLSQPAGRGRGRPEGARSGGGGAGARPGPRPWRERSPGCLGASSPGELLPRGGRSGLALRGAAPDQAGVGGASAGWGLGVAAFSLSGPGVPGLRGQMSPAPDHDYLRGCVFFFHIEHHGLISRSPHAEHLRCFPFPCEKLQVEQD